MPSWSSKLSRTSFNRLYSNWFRRYCCRSRPRKYSAIRRRLPASGCSLALFSSEPSKLRWVLCSTSFFVKRFNIMCIVFCSVFMCLLIKKSISSDSSNAIVGHNWGNSGLKVIICGLGSFSGAFETSVSLVFGKFVFRHTLQCNTSCPIFCDIYQFHMVKKVGFCRACFRSHPRKSQAIHSISRWSLIQFSFLQNFGESWVRQTFSQNASMLSIVLWLGKSIFVSISCRSQRVCAYVHVIFCRSRHSYVVLLAGAVPQCSPIFVWYRYVCHV